ncbi:MAG: hypothetical protein EOP53_12680 [Sphingobacteriales bacterium]|nr:MAG: hypothetical protein EOP53_12680 [Sphingobacteriales bacterium]
MSSTNVVTDSIRLEIDQVRAAVAELKNLYEDIAKGSEKAGKKSSDAFNKSAKSVDDLRANLKHLETQRDAAMDSKAVRGFNRQIEETEKKISKATSSTGFLHSTLGKVAVAAGAAFAVGTIVNFAAEAANAALRAEGIERAFTKLNRPDLLDKLREATKGTVDDITLMQNAVKANNFKIPLDTLGKMFAFAEQRAKDTGESVDYLVESAVLGISRESVMIIDNLGISSKAVENEMKKTGNFAVAVTNIMSQELEKQGKTVDGAAVRVERYTAQWNNFKIGFGKMVVDLGVGAAQLLEGFDTGLKGFFNTVSGGKLFPAKEKIQEEAKDYTKTFYAEVKKAALAGDKSAQQELARRFQNAPKIKPPETIESIENQIKLLESSLKGLAINSDKFLERRAEITKLKAVLDSANGKNATVDKSKELEKTAFKELQKLKDENAAAEIEDENEVF